MNSSAGCDGSVESLACFFGDPFSVPLLVSGEKAMRDLCLHPRLHLGMLLSSLAGRLLVICTVCVLLGGCALPPPETLVSPTPTQGNSGKFLNPYLVDGKLAPWADKGVHANRMGA